MNNLEIAKDIIVAMINNQIVNVNSDDCATSIANAYEIVFNKINELYKK